jgi:epoxyqueuosine reductase
MRGSLDSRLKAAARARGFSLAGIAPATDADGFGRFRDWLARGYHGEMDYLARLSDERRHPESVLESVRSVLMVGLEYGERGTRNAELEVEDRPARVASYATGPDYHRFVWDRLNDLADWLMREVPGCSALGVADTAPLLERDFARRAGLGWVGKNTMLINKHRGSFFFLGALLTDLALTPDEPHSANHCGTCTACLDACPTAAFPEPGLLDARRCISYLTIELRSPIPEDLREPVGPWLFGCDVCQDVCPWNHRTEGEPVPFPTDPALVTLDPIEMLGLTEEEFRRRFRGTVFFRTRRSGLLRNAAIVLGNVGDQRALPALEAAARDEDPVIREAAAWAIERIRGRKGNRPA